LSDREAILGRHEPPDSNVFVARRRGGRPQFSEQVRRTFAVRKLAALATLRRDESPRSSGTEVDFAADGNRYLGRVPCSLKALDLRCDPRLALHCRTEDNPADHPAACWATARWPVRRWGLRSQPGRSAAPLPHRRDRSGPHQRRRGRWPSLHPVLATRPRPAGTRASV